MAAYIDMAIPLADSKPDFHRHAKGLTDNTHDVLKRIEQSSVSIRDRIEARRALGILLSRSRNLAYGAQATQFPRLSSRLVDHAAHIKRAIEINESAIEEWAWSSARSAKNHAASNTAKAAVKAMASLFGPSAKVRLSVATVPADLVVLCSYPLDIGYEYVSALKLAGLEISTGFNIQPHQLMWTSGHPSLNTAIAHVATKAKHDDVKFPKSGDSVKKVSKLCRYT